MFNVPAVLSLLDSKAPVYFTREKKGQVSGKVEKVDGWE